MQDFEWLKELKVGDKVAVDNSDHWHRNNYSIHTVEKITPTGRIKLSSGSVYFPNGKKVGESYCYPLRQLTPEIIELVRRRRLMDKLNFNSFKGLLSSERLEILLEWQAELTKED